MRLHFEIQGSAADPYIVAIERIGNSLIATCDCPAGLNGQHCKHRLRLLQGDPEGVIGGDIQRICEIPSMLSGTDVQAAIGRLSEAEREAELAKKKVSAAKKALARCMTS